MALGLGEPSKLTKYKRKIAAPLQTKESRKQADDELIFSLEEEHVSDLSQTQSLTFPVSGTGVGGGGGGGGVSSVSNVGHQFSQTGSLKLKNRSPNRLGATRYNSVRLSRHVCNPKHIFIVQFILILNVYTIANNKFFLFLACRRLSPLSVKKTIFFCFFYFFFC